MHYSSVGSTAGQADLLAGACWSVRLAESIVGVPMLAAEQPSTFLIRYARHFLAECLRARAHRKRMKGGVKEEERNFEQKREQKEKDCLALHFFKQCNSIMS